MSVSTVGADDKAEYDAGVLPIMSIFLGPPGAGKSMLARRLTTILPAMTLAGAMETTRIRSVVGLTGERTALGAWVGLHYGPITAAALSGGGLVKTSLSPLGSVSLLPRAGWSVRGYFL